MLPAVCSDGTVTGLIANEVVRVGSVEIWNDEESLYVVYATSPEWPIQKTALFVGGALGELPVSGGGNPRVGQFPYKSRHRDDPTQVIWEVPLDDFATDELQIAAFAQLTDELAGAWAEGEMIAPGGNWSMYLSYSVGNCAAETVDEDGAVVTSRDGNASLSIPAGALGSPVDITIEPATIEDLLEHEAVGSAAALAAGRSGAASAGDADPSRGPPVASATVEPLPTVNGVRPIQNTIWDFGPDGTAFTTPIQVILKYADADLPDGVDETKLGLFVTNGIFERPPSTVDPVSNTVTAYIDHFSYAFVGFEERPEVDLVGRGVNPDKNPIELGETIQWTATVANLSDTDVDDVVVTYLAFGDAVAAPVGPDCTEVPPTPGIGNAAVECFVGDVPAGEVVAAPSAGFVPQSTGTEIALWASVSSDGSDDPDPFNNRAEATYDVVPQSADLTLYSILGIPDPAPAGTPIRIVVQVSNEPSSAQSVQDAVLQLNVGDATLVSASDEACFQNPTGVTCPIADLPPGVIAGYDIDLLPADGADALVVAASISPPFSVTDPDPSNNIGGVNIPIGVPGSADLVIPSGNVSPDPVEVGLPFTVSSTIQNLGPDPAPGARVWYQVFGDVVVGNLVPACQEVPGFLGDVVVRCDVGDLGSPAFSAAPPATFIPQTADVMTIWISPGSAADDPDPENDRFTTDVTAIRPQADLFVQTVVANPNPIPAGAPVVFTVVAGNDPSTLQDVEGANLFLTTSGASFVSDPEGRCFGTALEVTCPLDVLPAGLLEGFDLTFQPDPGADLVQLNARVEVPFGTEDPDPTNDAQGITVLVGGESADVQVTALSESADPASVGSTVVYTATLFNAGPTDVATTSTTYTFEGDVALSFAPPICTVQATSPDLELLCTGPPLVSGGTESAATVAIVPLSAGSVTATATVTSPVADPDPGNNSLQEGLTVIEATADLQIQSIVDSVDPVVPGGSTTYSIEVLATGTPDAVVGAILQLAFTGDVAVTGYNGFCEEDLGGVLTCALEPLTPGFPALTQVTVQLLTAGQTVLAQARVIAPLGFTDSDPTNNTGTETTTVSGSPEEGPAPEH